ncbi:MAG: guanylate kinase [bacterium]
MKPGRIVIISSPSGGGKSSICRKLLSPARKTGGWRFSISCTTRDRRPGERNGREYSFVSTDEFDRLVKSGAFAEHFRVHLYRYGTPRRPLEDTIKHGGVMILDVDVQGAARLKSEYPQALTIFVLPPSVRELKKRLKARGTETAAQLKVRFENARREMRLYHRFDYAVVNRDLKVAVRQVLAIIEAHPCRTELVSTEHIKRITG